MGRGVAKGGAESLLNGIYPVSAATTSSSGNKENQYSLCAYWEPSNVAYSAISKTDNGCQLMK